MNRDEATERLFTTVIPSFEAREATTGQLSNLLWMDLQLRLDPTERGFATIYHSNDHSLLAPIRLQDITVKDVLNEIVRRRKSAAWIGFPAPVNLLNVPGDKLWNIVTYDDPPAAVTELCCLDRNNLPAN